MSLCFEFIHIFKKKQILEVPHKEKNLEIGKRCNISPREACNCKLCFLIDDKLDIEKLLKKVKTKINSCCEFSFIKKDFLLKN